jgi:hypothetical protein
MVRAAAGEGEAVAVELGRALGRYGVAQVSVEGPYYKDETLLEFGATLEPRGRVGDCVDTLMAGAATGWNGSPEGAVWARPCDGTTFLHPRLDWAALSPEEAATVPRYVEGDLVRILDGPEAGREGLTGVEAEVLGRSAPVGDNDVWTYAVRPVTRETVICFGEPLLAPTGHRAPERPV